MTASALFAFLHFVAVFGIFATVFLEWQTMSPAPTLGEAKRMQRCDRWYGLFAVHVNRHTGAWLERPKLRTAGRHGHVVDRHLSRLGVHLHIEPILQDRLQHRPLHHGVAR